MRCLIVDDDPIYRTVLERYLRQTGDLQLVASCGSAVEAANILRRDSVDLVFLDVDMPEMTGLDLIRSLERCPAVILVTGSGSHAVDAFELAAADYLLKPLDYPRFLRAVERARGRIGEPRAAPAPGSIFIRTEGRRVRLDLRDIHRVEAKGDYVLIHTPRKPYMVHATMKSIEDLLPASDFVRVHRSHLVRLDRIDDVEEATLVIGREVIPVGASYRGPLLARLPTL